MTAAWAISTQDEYFLLLWVETHRPLVWVPVVSRGARSKSRCVQVSPNDLFVRFLYLKDLVQGIEEDAQDLGIEVASALLLDHVHSSG